MNPFPADICIRILHEDDMLMRWLNRLARCYLRQYWGSLTKCYDDLIIIHHDYSVKGG